MYEHNFPCNCYTTIIQTLEPVVIKNPHKKAFTFSKYFHILWCVDIFCQGVCLVQLKILVKGTDLKCLSYKKIKRICMRDNTKNNKITKILWI